MGLLHFPFNVCKTGGNPLELLSRADLGNHDLGMDLNPFLHQFGCGLQDCPHLHLVDRWIGNPQPHPPMSEHGVDLGEILDLLQNHFPLRDQFLVEAFALDLG